MNRRLTLGLQGLLVVGSFVLAGCGSGDSGDGGGTASGGPSPTATGTPVSAALTDYAIDLSETTVAPGTYTFRVEEKGEVPHALSISGPGLDTTSTDVLEPGDSEAELTVILEAGTYEVWCPVGSHRAQGMETSITVQ